MDQRAADSGWEEGGVIFSDGDWSWDVEGGRVLSARRLRERLWPNGTLVVLPPPWRGFYVQLNRETFRVRTFLPNIITDNWVFFLNFLLFFYTISPFLALRQPAMFSERLSPLRLWGLVKLCLAPSFLASQPTTSPLPSTQLTALRPENQDDKSQRSHPFKP